MFATTSRARFRSARWPGGWTALRPIENIADIYTVRLHAVPARTSLPSYGGRAPEKDLDATREEIRAVALARPREFGEPGTRWSLTTLRRYLPRKRVVTISKEHLRRILVSMGITAQRTRT